jgi:cytidylate kinase
MRNPSTDPLVVTLDGPAGVGKTTLARLVAQALDVAYLDTGAMFRVTALKLGEKSWELPRDILEARLEGITFDLTGTGLDSRLLCGGSPVGDEVRTEEVGMWASNLAARPEVRERQKAAQRAIGLHTSLVAEGRDMGTVVFPSARRKFFLDAAPGIRAARRVAQLREMGREADLASIEAAIRARDDQDRNRAVAPLVPARDAVVIDTSGLGLEEVFEMVMKEIRAA